MHPLFRLLFLLPSLSHALLVAPNSPCAASCGNNLLATSGAEITCQDQSYGTTTYGATFETCINCEIGSTYVDPQSGMNDLQAALYNVRFALSWCLFGYDNNTQVTDSQCLTSFVAHLPGYPSIYTDLSVLVAFLAFHWRARSIPVWGIQKPSRMDTAQSITRPPSRSPNALHV
jgi:hypothetical protein